MRKIIPVIMMIIFSNAAMASKYFIEGDGGRCWINYGGWNYGWFCGKLADTCSGKKVTGGNRRQYYKAHGEKFEWEGKTLYCCNGTTDEAGRFIESDHFFETEIKTIDIDYGKCSYEIKKDICGNIVEDKPCTEATETCARGILKRNEVCIPPCEDGFAFESETSNKCIACPETTNQGIKGIGYDKICIKCKSNQILDQDTYTCKSPEEKKQELTTAVKAGLKVIATKETMAKCFRCAGNVLYKQCLLLLDTPEKLDDSIDKADIKKECFLDN